MYFNTVAFYQMVNSGKAFIAVLKRNPAYHAVNLIALF